MIPALVTTLSGRRRRALSNPLSTGLVGQWKCNEASGALLDSSGNGLDLTAVNSPGAGTGVISGCRTFVKASNQYFTRNDETKLRRDKDFTISFWWKYPGSEFAHLICKRSGGSVEFLIYQALAGNLNWFGPWGDVSYVTISSPSVGTWYNIITTWNNTTKVVTSIVNNGTPNVLSPRSTAITGTTAKFQIGNSNDGTGDAADASLDIIQMWDRILTAGEITAVYNGGAGVEL